MKNNKKQIKEILNQLYTTNSDFDSMTLSYVSKFYPQIFSDENFYENVELDEKIKEAQEVFNFISNKNIELMIELNNLLDKEDQNIEVLKLEEKMKEIQVKKFITVKDFEKIYNISSSSQKGLRGRLNDPIPYHQKVQGGKIVYVVEEVEKWFENQYK
ncbi:hypothetical protein [Arcobacter arenosus]|uniref:hypothetical protein n=1 Tax=Arcobacter arenosus TaxID=2576037 RepID=UPI003BAA39B2